MTNYKLDKMLNIKIEMNELEARLKLLKKDYNKYANEFKEQEPNGKTEYKNCIFNLYDVHRERLDSKKLKEEHQDIYQKYVIYSDSKTLTITIKEK